MNSASPIEAPEAAPPPRHGVADLLFKGVALLVAAYVPALAIFLFVPEMNDYADVSRLKHERLERAPGRRIVLVGGSNLAFGIDSPTLERATGCQVVNMGMNGYFGVRFMLEEVKAGLRPNDIVVVAFEYDNFHKSVDGTGVDLLVVSKANPRALDYLTWSQRAALALAVPFGAQQKILRLLRQAKDRALAAALDRGPATLEPGEVDINQIESASGFTDRGDLLSHLDVVWPLPLEEGVDMTHIPRDSKVVGLIDSFADEMKASGVIVLISYTPAIREYYERHKAAIDGLHHAMVSASMAVPSPPSTFVYDRPLFFDTVYHLNKEGRALRSSRLAADITRYFQGAPCSSTLEAAHE